MGLYCVFTTVFQVAYTQIVKYVKTFLIVLTGPIPSILVHFTS